MQPQIIGKAAAKYIIDFKLIFVKLKLLDEQEHAANSKFL